MAKQTEVGEVYTCADCAYCQDAGDDHRCVAQPPTVLNGPYMILSVNPTVMPSRGVCRYFEERSTHEPKIRVPNTDWTIRTEEASIRPCDKAQEHTKAENKPEQPTCPRCGRFMQRATGYGDGCLRIFTHDCKAGEPAAVRFFVQYNGTWADLADIPGVNMKGDTNE